MFVLSLCTKIKCSCYLRPFFLHFLLLSAFSSVIRSILNVLAHVINSLFFFSLQLNVIVFCSNRSTHRVRSRTFLYGVTPSLCSVMFNTRNLFMFCPEKYSAESSFSFPVVVALDAPMYSVPGRYRRRHGSVDDRRNHYESVVSGDKHSVSTFPPSTHKRPFRERNHGHPRRWHEEPHTAPSAWLAPLHV